MFDIKVKEKVRKGQRQDQKEYKINYRSRAARNQQMRVMDHILGDKSFKLDDLPEL